MPIRKSWRQKELLSTHYAHRGLHNKTDKPENSMPAFEAAVEVGYGIELDVQLSHNGEVVVFHDFTLDRMTGIKGVLTFFSWPQLREMRLAKSEERIPLLREVLEMVDGRVPLLIEIKPQDRPGPIVEALHELLRDYDGPYMIESFNPWALREFYKYNNRVWLGQLSKRYPDILGRLFLTTFLCNTVSKPDFVAYDIKAPFGLVLRYLRRRYHKPMIAWTVRNHQQFEEAQKHYDAVIFEKIRP